MAEKLRDIKKSADTVLLELDPEYSKLKIGYGESFYYHVNEIWLSETSLQDPTLVPFGTVVIKDGIMEFDAAYKNTNMKFSIHPVYQHTVELARFLQYLQEHNLEIKKNYRDSISILIEEDGAIIRLANTAENKRAVIIFSKKYGNTFLERFPDPSKKFQIQSCLINGDTLTINCEGSDLYNPTSSVFDYTYQWKLDIQDEFLKIIPILIQAAIVNG